MSKGMEQTGRTPAGTARVARWTAAAAIAASVVLGATGASAGASAPSLAAGSASAARDSLLARHTAQSTYDVNASLAAGSDHIGDEFVFWKGQDANLWYSIYSDETTSWGTAGVVPGMAPLGSEPAVIVDQYEEVVSPEANARSEALHPQDAPPPAYIGVFWQGQDNNLYYVEGTVNYGATPLTITWETTSPVVVPGMGPLGSAPTATYVNNGADAGLYVFWKGTDGNLWSVKGTVSGDTVTWPSTPRVIPGMATLGSAPTAGADYAGNIYIYWQGGGSNTHLWETWYDEEATTPAWTNAPIDLGQISGNIGSAPSVAVAGSGQQYIFWQGQDGNLYYDEWTGGVLAGPESNAGADIPLESGTWLNGTWNYAGQGPMNSAPAASITLGSEPTTLSVFWKGTNSNIWMASAPTTTLTWTGPTSVGFGPLDGQ